MLGTQRELPHILSFIMWGYFFYIYFLIFIDVCLRGSTVCEGAWETRSGHQGPWEWELQVVVRQHSC